MDTLTIAASGVRSAEIRLANSAHDVANLTSDDFRSLETLQSSLAGGGSQVQTRQHARPLETDLAREHLEQMRASLQLRASLRVASTAEDLLGGLVDLLA